MPSPSASTAYVALGANLGDAAASVRTAINALALLPVTRLVRSSSLYRTAAQGGEGPDYVNAVAELYTSLRPHALLEHLQQLENAAGRTRPFLNAPRTLDLDLLLYGCERIATATLAVPHPRMDQRAFVLVPLAEIAPARVEAAALQAVAGQMIARIG